jgi:hypothetical protein
MGQQSDNHNNRDNQSIPQYPQNMNMNSKNMYQRNPQMLHHQPPQPPYPQQRQQNYPQSPQSSQNYQYQQQQQHQHQQQGRPMQGRAQRQSFPINDQSEYSDNYYNNGGSKSARNPERDRERQEYGQQLFNDNNGYNQNARYEQRPDYNRSMNRANYSNDYGTKSNGSSYSNFNSATQSPGSMNSGYTSGAQNSQQSNQLNNQNVLNRNKLNNQNVRNNNNQSTSSFNSSMTDRSRAVR